MTKMETHRQEIKKINRVFGSLLEMNASWTGRCRLNATQICFQFISQDKISILSSYEEEKVKKSGFFPDRLLSCPTWSLWRKYQDWFIWTFSLVALLVLLTLLAIWRYRRKPVYWGKANFRSSESYYEWLTKEATGQRARI